jgi:hypothetical protein
VALLTAVQFSSAGTTAAYVAVSASDTVNWDPRLGMIVKNAGGSSDTCTIVIPGNGPAGIAIPDNPVTVPATTGEKWIFLGDPTYQDPATGLVTITHSFTTSVTCAVVRIA